MKVVTQTEMKALGLLDDLGILAEIEYGYLQVNRTSMVQFAAQGVEEGEAYDQVLAFLQGEFPGHRVTWGGRTDDHLLAVFYDRGVSCSTSTAPSSQ